MASRLDFSRDAKVEKRKKLEAMGVNPHPYSFAVSHSVAEARKAEGKEVKIAGRVISVREHGKVTFIDLRDQTGEIQVMLRSDELATKYDIVNLLDPGDFIGVSGKVELSKTKELTVLANTLEVLGKSLRPLPTTWQGIDDQETRYRKRYLDMIINPVVKKTLDARWLIEKEIRRFLQDVEHYTEVETPVLQPLYGGTNARPFTTHMNALDSDYYLRVAPELYLKRLIVGGYERIFEIARNFRNEGIDHTHQPEFTMMEWYEAYADYNRIMDVAEGLIKHLAEKLHGKHEMQVGEQKIDLSGRWPRITMHDALLKFEKVDVDKLNDAQLQAELDKRDLKFIGAFSRGKAIFSLFDKTVPAKLINPTWIIDYPKEVSPLSKQHRNNPELVERFECYIGSKEICDGWSEVTDGLEQRRRFETEQQHMRDGDEEAQPLDEEFLEAMEYGMPPLGGIGIGIDRLVMFLTNTWAIREVIAFPTLKPLVKLDLQPKVQIGKIQKFDDYAIEPAVLQKFPGMFFCYLTIKQVKIGKKNDVLEKRKADLVIAKKQITLEEIAAIPSIKGYQKLMHDTGTDFHKKRPSPEALLRRIVVGKPLYTINTAVDAYNLSVVESGIGLGGFNLDAVSEPVVLRFSRQGEKMHLLGDDTDTTLREGQLVYADATQPITVDVNYRDIDATKITEKTKNVILFADGAPGLSEDKVISALKNGAKYIKEFAGGEISEVNVVR